MMVEMLRPVGRIGSQFVRCVRENVELPLSRSGHRSLGGPAFVCFIVVLDRSRSLTPLHALRVTLRSNDSTYSLPYPPMVVRSPRPLAP